MMDIKGMEELACAPQIIRPLLNIPLICGRRWIMNVALHTRPLLSVIPAVLFGFLKQNREVWGGSGVVASFPNWRASLQGAVCLQHSYLELYI